MLRFFRACFAALALAPSFHLVGANLIGDDIWDRASVIAYDFPNAEGRADAIRYVESIRDQLKPGAKVVDASANPASLPRNLILYTTLSGHAELLRRGGTHLNWSVAEGSFRWHELTVPADEVRLIVAGKNPYSRGDCVIYAADSNRGIVDINALPHGRVSWSVFQGDRLLREGYFSRRFAQTDRISRTAALADVDQFFRTLERVHPNLFMRADKDGYLRLKQGTRAAIATGRDEIAVEDLAALLMRAAAYLRDGHTWVDWWTTPSEWNTRGKRFPAFELTWDNGSFFISAARDHDLLGSEIVDIGGLPAGEFMGPILDACAGETAGVRAYRFLLDEPFLYYLTNRFGGETRYPMKVRNTQGQVRETMLETLTWPDYQAFRKTEGPAAFEPNNRGTAVEFFDSGATAHFLYSAFHSSAAEKKKIEGVFHEVQTNHSRNLILDLRGNTGGVSDMAELIFSRIYGEKFRSFRAVRVRASWDILRQVPWWARPPVVVLRGHAFSHAMPEHSPSKSPDFFSGRAYLLVDNGTFSMASSFATMFRDYRVGTILGYETGGAPDSFGGPHPFRLKNSGISCFVAWTENIPPFDWPGDRERGVSPDVPLSREKLAEFSGEKDPALAFTLRYIASR